MMSRHLLGFALAAAAAVAACGESTDTLTDGTRGNNSTAGTETPGTDPSTPGSTPGGATDDTDIPAGPIATNSPAGKTYYKANVHPFLASSCGGCHSATGPGPSFLTPDDAEKTYAQLFKVGYVAASSRLTVKPAHGGVTTNVLSAAQIGTFNQWVAMELKDGGQQAPPNVLAKLGSCMDKTLFDAMKMGDWRTQTRNNNNNTNNVTPWNENQDTCTGCKPAPCSVCHSSDPGTNYNNAIGNTLLPADTTFNNTKLTSPAYITKFFGVSPDGKAMASDGIKKKATATTKDKRDTHPLFLLNAQQQTLLDAFVNDAVTKYNAGSCGQ